jgi:hypothetical protein
MKEYKIIYERVNKVEIEEELNNLAKDYWRVVATIGGYIILERERMKSK